MTVLRGSCACGSVRYEIAGALIGPVTYCHCWRCRKHSGSSFGTTAGVRADDFTIVRGHELMKCWTSSPGVDRFFAGCCGSPIYKSGEDGPGVYGFRLGTLDTDPGVRVEQHYMIESKAPWVDLHDALEKVPGGERPYPAGPAYLDDGG